MKFLTATVLFVLMFILLSQAFSQSNSNKSKEGDRIFQQNQNIDSSINREMAFFTRQNGNISSAETIKLALIEIPLQYCTKNEVHLSLSKFNSSVSTFIHLYFKGESPYRQLDSIFIVTHSHFHVNIPAVAYEGLINNNICEVAAGGKKKVFFSSNYKAYYSKDKRRMYIYMTGGADKDQYEVTWIFENDKFIKRVLTKIP